MIEIFTNGVLLAFDPISIAAIGASLVGGIGSLVGSAKLNKRRHRNLNTQKAESDAWYNKEMYTPEIDRTENQAAIKLLNDNIRKNTKRAQATNAITGATPEVALAQTESANKAYGDVVTRLASNASNRRTSLANMKRADDKSFYLMQDNFDAGKAQDWANLGANSVQLGANALLTLPGSTSTPNAASPATSVGNVIEEIPLLT